MIRNVTRSLIRTGLRSPLFAAGLASVVLATSGCQGPDATAGADAAIVDNGPDMAGPPPDLWTPSPYPGKPYGYKVGDTIYPIASSGYALDRDHTGSSGTVPWGKVLLADLHANPACQCIILSEAARWCGPCNQEQDELTTVVASDPTLCVFNVLIDGIKPGVRANQADVDAWTQQHDQNFPVVAANIITYDYLPNPSALPTNVVIRPSDMKILAINEGIGPTTIKDAKALCAAP